jgi:toxin ParE1/3/4
MTKRWRVHEEAFAEIDATVAWYDGQRAGLGLEFMSELRSTLAEVRTAPAVSTVDPDAPADAHVRRRRLHRFPYAVVFAEGPTE